MQNNKGFTLIEMLVVIAIIGLLSSVVVIGLGGSRSKARDARRIADIQQIQNALEVGYTPASGYPTTIPAGAPTTDPQGNTYLYTSSGGESYKLGVCLENDQNPPPSDADITNKCPSGLGGGATTGGTCSTNAKKYCVAQ